MEHELEKVVGGHRCKTCGYTWTHKPKSRCVGMPLYGSPTHELRTKTQWLTVKRQIKGGERPAGCYWSSYDYINLWREEQTEPITRPVLTEEQRAERRERQRRARTCGTCGHVQRKVGDLTLFHKGRVRTCAACLNRLYDEEAAAHQAMLDADRAQSAAWAARMLARPAQKWCILDTETVSLEGAIIEIAVIDGAGDVLLDTRVQPRQAITPQAQAIHHITDEDLINAPTFPQIYDALADALRGRRVVIYHASFDEGRLAYECQRWRLPFLTPMRTRVELVPLLPGQWRTVDTRGVVRSVSCAMERYSAWAGAWSDYFHDYRWLPLHGGHSALSDCLAVRERLIVMAGAANAASARDASPTISTLKP